jgi:AcrR family transcriptional regulator
MIFLVFMICPAFPAPPGKQSLYQQTCIFRDSGDTQEMSTSDNPNNKDELFWRILNAALQLECTKGHMRWKMTDLSRNSGVTRSLIYYYFGNSKIKIVQEGIRQMGEEFFGLSEERMELWRAGKFGESLRRTRELVKHTPYIVVFYLQQRRAGTTLSKEIEALEERYLEKLSKRFPSAPRDNLVACFAALLGFAALADVSDATIESAVQILTKALSSS